jgi:predicted CXXCH cytochrome family protein
MFMKRKKILSWSLAMAISLLLCGGGISYAKVTGVCSNCHTMHNSEDGGNMILNPALDGTDPNPYLTRGSCVGCHTGTNSVGSRPFVYNTSAPTNPLAGGNFYWVTQDDATGHNVKGIPLMSLDGTLDVAPGDDGTGTFACADSCHASLYTTTLVDTGCEGCHIEPKHHAPQQIVGDPALEANGFYRFLSGHNPGSGVHGIEDDDWQYTNSAFDHNEYLGNTASTDHTMTGYCVGCHGNFHIQQDANSNWIRHPSDAVLPEGPGEYTAYLDYDPNVPVARPDLEAIANTGLVANNADMVMCLSCHRAHGSEYIDMLRWNNDTMVAGGGGADGTGCFKCHSEKD